MAEVKTFKIEEKNLPAVLVVSKRWKGRYQDTGSAFAELGKKVGRFISGKPMNLYHDAEFKEDQAEIESCFPLRRKPESVPSGLQVQELPSGKFVSLVHQGPYTELGKSYEKLFAYLHAKGLAPRDAVSWKSQKVSDRDPDSGGLSCNLDIRAVASFCRKQCCSRKTHNAGHKVAREGGDRRVVLHDRLVIELAGKGDPVLGGVQLLLQQSEILRGAQRGIAFC